MTLDQAKQMDTAHCSKHKRELEVIYYCPDCDKEINSSQLEAQISNANDDKIRWYMELALKMREEGYSDASIYSIDIEAWDEYRVNQELTPVQALAEEESNG